MLAAVPHVWQIICSINMASFLQGGRFKAIHGICRGGVSRAGMMERTVSRRKHRLMSCSTTTTTTIRANNQNVKPTVMTLFCVVLDLVIIMDTFIQRHVEVIKEHDS